MGLVVPTTLRCGGVSGGSDRTTAALGWDVTHPCPSPAGDTGATWCPATPPGLAQGEDMVANVCVSPWWLPGCPRAPLDGGTLAEPSRRRGQVGAATSAAISGRTRPPMGTPRVIPKATGCPPAWSHLPWPRVPHPQSSCCPCGTRHLSPLPHPWGRHRGHQHPTAGCHRATAPGCHRDQGLSPGGTAYSPVLACHPATIIPVPQRVPAGGTSPTSVNATPWDCVGTWGAGGGTHLNLHGVFSKSQWGDPAPEHPKSPQGASPFSH